MRLDWNAIAKIGVPAAIAVFLVYRLASGFDTFDLRLKALEAQHTLAADSALAAKDLAGRALMTNERVLFVLQTMCVNDAKTADARERCLREPTR